MRTRLLVLSLSSAAAVALGARAMAAQSPLMLVPLRMDQVMSADQFTRAGLSRLTPEQRLHLDSWLTRYTAELRQAMEQSGNTIAGAGPVSARPAVATTSAARKDALAADGDASSDEAASAQQPRAVGWTVSEGRSTPPAANGEPATGVSAPVAGSMVNAETSSEYRFAT